MAKDINPNSRTPFVNQNGGLSKYGMDVILRLYQALDFVGDTSSLADLISQGLALAHDVDSVADYEYLEINTNFTTYTNSFINVTSQCVITLNTQPNDAEQVTVHKNTGSESDYIEVTDGTGTDRFVRDQTVLSYRYSIDLNQWIRGG